MESDTFVNSSPIAKCPQPASNTDLFGKNIGFRNEVRDILNPYQRAQSHLVFALPMKWYDILNRIISSQIPDHEKRRYQNLKRDIEHYVFPRLSPSKTIINVKTSGISDPLVGVSMWLMLYDLPKHLKLCGSNKLNYIQTSVLAYLKRVGATRFPFTMILSHSQISMPKMKLIHRKLASKVAERTVGDQRPLFTLHLQDQQSPFVLFWLDTENVCSFNLTALESPEALADFANTFILFVNFSLSNALCYPHSSS